MGFVMRPYRAACVSVGVAAPGSHVRESLTVLASRGCAEIVLTPTLNLENLTSVDSLRPRP